MRSGGSRGNLIGSARRSPPLAAGCFVVSWCAVGLDRYGRQGVEDVAVADDADRVLVFFRYLPVRQRLTLRISDFENGRGSMRLRGRVRTLTAAASVLAVTPLAACTAEEPGQDAQTLREALQPLHEAGSFRVVGEIRNADGTRTSFDARVNVHDGCKGRIGGADSLVSGRRVWTRWDDAAVPDAVRALDGGRSDLAQSPADDRQWAAVQLLRGAYMVTPLPADRIELEGIAPVCDAARLIADAGAGSNDVAHGAVVERDKERVRPLTRRDGTVTIRVYVPEKGKPVVRFAEYRIEEGRTFSIRFSDLDRPAGVTPPMGVQTVSSAEVVSALQDTAS